MNEQDIIVEVNNQPIRSLEDVMRCLQARSEPVLKILRASTGKSFNVTLSTLDIMRPISTTTKTPFAMAFERRESGLVVTSVAPGGVADNGGLKIGDIIMQIGSEVKFSFPSCVCFSQRSFLSISQHDHLLNSQCITVLKTMPNFYLVLSRKAPKS